MPEATVATLPPEFGTRYEVQNELGRGGMATVWRARDCLLDRDVAIKSLHPEATAVLDRDRFLQEIRITARLVHPGILPLFDSGSNDGRLFYVMPLVRGETLRTRLDREQRLPVRDAIDLIADVAEALAYAHGEGIVHRDLKPENIFCHGGRATLADFGVSYAQSDNTDSRVDPSRLTAVGMVVGTPHYLSPEQALGESDIDGRADLYAVGCLLYELLAGAPPFAGSTMMAIIAQHVTAEPPDLLAVRPEAGTQLSRIVTKLLAKERAARYINASALLAELRHVDGTGPGHLSDGPGEHSGDTPRVVPGSAHRIADAAAREAYVTGRAYWLRSMHGGSDTAIKLTLARNYLDRALKIAPDNATILTAIGDCIAVAGLRGFMPKEAGRIESERLYHQVLGLDDAGGLIHSSLGVILLYQTDDFEAAGAEFKLSCELDPNDAMLRRQYGNFLKMAGRIDAALTEMRAAVALDPKAAFIQLGLGDCLIAAGRNDEAVDPLRAAMRLAPGYFSALERLEIACHRAGRHAEAGVARRTMHNIAQRLDRAALVEADIASFGWPTARAMDVRRDLEALLKDAESADPFADRGSRQPADAIMAAYADLGEWSFAMDWVERGYHRRPGRLRRVLTDLLFDRRGLASDPRYATLLRNAGLEELL